MPKILILRISNPGDYPGIPDYMGVVVTKSVQARWCELIRFFRSCKVNDHGSLFDMHFTEPTPLFFSMDSLQGEHAQDEFDNAMELLNEGQHLLNLKKLPEATVPDESVHCSLEVDQLGIVWMLHFGENDNDNWAGSIKYEWIEKWDVDKEETSGKGKV